LERELIKGIERLFPESIGGGAPRIPTEPLDVDFLDMFGREACPVRAARDGYLQLVDGDALMTLAMEEDIVIRLERRPGHYVIADRPLVLVWPGNKVNDQLVDRINSAFALGNQRTPGQDIEFAVTHLSKLRYEPFLPG
jgi:uncharacterized membrane protein